MYLASWERLIQCNAHFYLIQSMWALPKARCYFLPFLVLTSSTLSVYSISQGKQHLRMFQLLEEHNFHAVIEFKCLHS